MHEDELSMEIPQQKEETASERIECETSNVMSDSFNMEDEMPEETDGDLRAPQQTRLGTQHLREPSMPTQ